MQAQILQQIAEARRARKAVAVVTDVPTGDQVLYHPGEWGDDDLGREIASRMKSGKSGLLGDTGSESFIQVHVPSARLVIIGAVHISQALVPMAQACGLDVTVIDPRTAFASAERFTQVELHADWPQDVLQTRPLDAYTALVAVTHDPKIDDLPLQSALKEGCFYIGALGSRKTHGKRVARFEESGIDAAQLDGIHAPIGLDIGAANPAEIAVSIMAQIIQTLRRGTQR